MPKYVIEVRRQSSGWGWLIFGVLLFVGIGALVNANDHPKPPLQQLENPYGDGPDDEPPRLAPNPYDDIPLDTAKPEPIIKTEKPRSIVTPAAGRVVAEAKINDDGECVVSGSLTAKKTVSLNLEVDTGAGAALWVSATYLKALGIEPNSLHFREQDPRIRFGKVATVALREVRIGGAVVKDVETQILTRWPYTFGDSENPLLGIPFLKTSGLHVEVNGDTCKMTGPAITIANLIANTR